MFWPAVSRSWPGVSGGDAEQRRGCGAAVATSGVSCVSRSAISASSSAMRRARLRSASFAAVSGSSSRLVSGRRRRHSVALPFSVLRVVNCSRRSLGAVRIRSPSCSMATDRDLTALSRATRSWRIASTIPVVCFGVTAPGRLSA